MTKVKQRPRRSDRKYQLRTQPTVVRGMESGYVLNRADFPMMPDDAFAFLQQIDASPAFQSILTDLATK